MTIVARRRRWSVEIERGDHVTSIEVDAFTPDEAEALVAIKCGGTGWIVERGSAIPAVPRRTVLLAQAA